jgi:hypothetical protein
MEGRDELVAVAVGRLKKTSYYEFVKIIYHSGALSNVRLQKRREEPKGRDHD